MGQLREAKSAKVSVYTSNEEATVDEDKQRLVVIGFHLVWACPWALSPVKFTHVKLLDVILDGFSSRTSRTASSYEACLASPE